MAIDLNELKNGKYASLNPRALNLKASNYYHRDAGKTSIGFVTPVVPVLARYFQERFQLPNLEVFYQKLKQSVSGDGGEMAKITALHSSSLCALLTFYNVSEAKPFCIEIDGKKRKYTEAFFEVKNMAISPRAPSNMDVVLVNSDKTEYLFIECKFSEYLNRGTPSLPEGYLKDQNCKKFFEKIGFKGMKDYPEGIKQLVAHYIGIGNFIDKVYDDKMLNSFYADPEDPRRNLYDKNRTIEHVAFMEVIYKLEGLKGKDASKFESYKGNAESVFKRLRENGWKKPFALLGTKTYQELFKKSENPDNNKILPPLVAAFYNLD